MAKGFPNPQTGKAGCQPVLVQRGLRLKVYPKPADWEDATAQDKNNCLIMTAFSHPGALAEVLAADEYIEAASYDCKGGVRIRTNKRHIRARPTASANALATAFDQMRKAGEPCYFGDEGVELEFDAYAYPRQVRTVEQREEQAARMREIRKLRAEGKMPPARKRPGAKKDFGRALSS